MAPTRTTFAGYERLAPGDPLSSDGYAFQFENPLIADRLGQLGAVTHKHDAHAAMVDPTTAHTVTTAATGGSIRSNTGIHVVYTLTDGQGGETLQRTAIVVTTATGYLTPATPPTAAADYTAGTLLANTYLYAVTVSDGAGGETALGPAASVTVDPGHANARALISGLTAITNTSSGSSSSSGWRLWRSVDGGSTWDLMGTGAHGTDTFTDTGSSAGDCTVSPPFTGTTVGTNKLTVTVPATSQPASATFFSIYADTTGQFLAPCLLGTYPVSDFGSAKVYTALTLLNGAPPAVSSCYPGANQINPSTDILNWTWKQTVANFAALPSVGNTNGDARVTLDTHSVYVWSGSAWILPPAGAPSGTAGGDLSSTYPNPTVAKLNGVVAASYALVAEHVNTVAASGAAQTLPDVTTDTVHYVTLTANCTFTFPTAAAGKSFRVGLLQDGTGTRTATWPGTVKWPGGVAPTLTVTVAKTDLLSFLCLDGTNWLGRVLGQNF